jgi:hypothetical protein
MNQSVTKEITLRPSLGSKEFREFSQTVQYKLEETGLIEILDVSQSRCMEMGSAECFVELVLHDGARITQGEELVLEMAQLFKGSDVRVVGVVRAVWSVASICYKGQCRDNSGLQKISECFEVELKAGAGNQVVEVEVLPSAFEEIDRELGPGTQVVEQVIRRLLEDNLAQGGLSYWNPVKNAKHNLDRIAAQEMIFRIKNPVRE